MDENDVINEMETALEIRDERFRLMRYVWRQQKNANISKLCLRAN